MFYVQIAFGSVSTMNSKSGFALRTCFTTLSNTMINLRVTNIIFKYISAVTCFALVCLLHAAISYRRMAVWHISVVSVTAVADTDTVLQVAVRRAIITRIRIRVRIRIGIFPSATAASIRITAENVCSGYR